jgi:ADP-heptose:LPS heptosyltransferase
MKILIIKLGALGDVVLATALIRAIQKAHRADEIHLLTAPAYLDIFAPWAGLAVTYFPRAGWLATARTIAWIRAGHFDRIYDLQSNDRSALLVACSGAPERVGNHPRYPYTHHPATPYRGQCHVFARYQEVLAAAGVDKVGALPWLPATEAMREKVQRWLNAQHLMGQPFAILHAGASPRHPEKLWPGFAGLAKALVAKGMQVVFVGADTEAAANRALAKASGAHSASGVFTIPELAELGRAARFAVTNDSGPMHVLAASGIPVFALFGSTDWRRNHALGQANFVCNYELFCADEQRDTKGIGGAEGLRQLGIAEIIARIGRTGVL